MTGGKLFLAHLALRSLYLLSALTTFAAFAVLVGTAIAAIGTALTGSFWLIAVAVAEIPVVVALFMATVKTVELDYEMSHR